MKKIFFLAVLIILISGVKNVFAQECNQECLKKQIDEYNQKISQLRGQASTLSNQIAQFNAQIKLAELKVQQTQEQIKLLGGRIDQVEISLQALSKAFSARAVATYKMAKTNEPVFYVLSASDLGEMVSKFKYLEEVQSYDQNLMMKLQTAQNTYIESKAESEDLAKQLQKEKDQLGAQKNAKGKLLASTQSDEKKYQQLLAQAQAQLAAFKRFVNGQGGASILSNQTSCSEWGCYYNQRDANWGTHALGSSSLTVAEYGCLVSASAMVASHYKKNVTPGDIANSADAFFSPNSGTALMWKDVTVNGMRILRNSIGVTTANIDSELAAGRPVIVGLYGGPAHFIVLKSGSGGNYVMNDPFMENGHDVAFTSKYAVSDITDVETISVQ